MESNASSIAPSPPLPRGGLLVATINHTRSTNNSSIDDITPPNMLQLSQRSSVPSSAASSISIMPSTASSHYSSVSNNHNNNNNSINVNNTIGGKNGQHHRMNLDKLLVVGAWHEYELSKLLQLQQQQIRQLQLHQRGFESAGNDTLSTVSASSAVLSSFSESDLKHTAPNIYKAFAKASSEALFDTNSARPGTSSLISTKWVRSSATPSSSSSGVGPRSPHDANQKTNAPSNKQQQSASVPTTRPSSKASRKGTKRSSKKSKRIKSKQEIAAEKKLHEIERLRRMYALGARAEAEAAAAAAAATAAALSGQQRSTRNQEEEEKEEAMRNAMNNNEIRSRRPYTPITQLEPLAERESLIAKLTTSIATSNSNNNSIDYYDTTAFITAMQQRYGLSSSNEFIRRTDSPISSTNKSQQALFGVNNTNLNTNGNGVDSVGAMRASQDSLSDFLIGIDGDGEAAHEVDDLLEWSRSLKPVLKDDYELMFPNNNNETFT